MESKRQTAGTNAILQLDLPILILKRCTNLTLRALQCSIHEGHDGPCDARLTFNSAFCRKGHPVGLTCTHDAWHEGVCLHTDEEYVAYYDHRDVTFKEISEWRARIQLMGFKWMSGRSLRR